VKLGQDPNWLLSTIAQSTAALVAIVGGFLVSRLLALITEAGSDRREHDALLAQLAALERAAEASDVSIQDMTAPGRGGIALGLQPELTTRGAITVELIVVEARIAVLEARRLRGLPAEVGHGFWTLGFFATSGCVFPIALLATDIRLTTRWEVLAVAAFTAGLVVLGTYLWSLRSRASRRED
jgi:hypothetical protein